LRTLIALLASLCVGTVYATEGPIRAILPFGPGSGTDTIARVLLEDMGKRTKQTFVIENRPGASGFIAAQAAATAQADGKTLLLTTNTTHSVNPVLFKKLPYDPVKDFRPIAMFLTTPYLLLVRQEMPVSTMKELVAWLRQHPDQASFGWGAAVSRMAGAAFLKRFDVAATGVPYKSSPQAITDLIGGQLSFVFLDVPAAEPLLAGGRLKPLLVTASQRLERLPGIPTAAEAGLPNFTVAAWVGLFAPAGTPDAQVKTLASAAAASMRDPSVIKRLENCCVPTVLLGDAFAEFISKDLVLWRERAAIAGIVPE
jgi:tripartite-type tricarboxylate transporter receptor subunit TctC